jgi:RNA polymerase sigma-70 factor, ECF subfamily
MDENELIEYAKEGDLTAFNRLVLTYQNIAYNVAFRIMGDHAAAEDAAQDSFIKAYRKLYTFKGGSFKVWLIRIVTNTCYDELRRFKRKPTTRLIPVTEYEEEVESPKWMTDPGELPEDTVLRDEIGRAIQHCLDGLKKDARTIVVLVDVQGMDYAEAAEVIRVPLGTVKSRLARARQSMQDCLREFGELLPSIYRLEPEQS